MKTGIPCQGPFRGARRDHQVSDGTRELSLLEPFAASSRRSSRLAPHRDDAERAFGGGIFEAEASVIEETTELA